MSKMGNYPFAVLHEQRTNGTPSAIALATRLSKTKLSKKEAIEYVRACVVTSGHPDLLDLYEQDGGFEGLIARSEVVEASA